LHLHSYVDPTRASPSLGGPERVACGERLTETEAARGAAVQMRGGVGLIYLHESAARGCGCRRVQGMSC
jgi:hypothetical protein